MPRAAKNAGSTAPKKNYKCVQKRTEERNELDKKALTSRINRVRGQVEGIQGMLEADAYCTDILVQVSAAQAAMKSFCRELIENHFYTTVADELASGNKESIEEFTNMLQKFLS